MNLSLNNINKTVTRLLPDSLEVKKEIFVESNGINPARYTLLLKSNAESSNHEDCGIGYNIQQRLMEYWSPNQLQVSINTNGPE